MVNENEFVIYDKENDELLCYVGGSENIIIYASKEEAEADIFCQGEEAVRCADLPLHWQETLLEQSTIKKD
jgi:hypothetical protein